MKDLKPVYVKTRMIADEKMYFLFIAYKGRAQNSEVILSGEHTDYRWATAESFVELEPNYIYDPDRELDIHRSDFLRDIVTAAKSK